MTEDESILGGIRVLDVASFIAGPAAATVMADFGADVIKVEPPGQGDPYRKTAGNPGNPAADVPYNWIVDNRNKRSIAVDLKAPAGREIMYRLVKSADVFVTNTPMAARERLGIRYEDVAPLNERLIYASLTAYGETGAEAGRTGFDSTALWARTGLMDLVKPDPDSAPARSLPGMGDHPTAITLFGAIMTALYRRERTGKGGKVATSLLANGVWWNAIWTQAALSGSAVRGRPAREQADNALHNLYRCRDGRWFHLVMLTQARKWQQFAEAVGRPELAEDPRFATPEARAEHTPALIPMLEAIFAERDWAEWRDVLSRNGITFGEIAKIEDVTHDRQMYDAGVFRAIADPAAGADWVVDSPFQVSGTEKTPARLAPALGQHTREVLGELGYDAAAIDRLAADGVIGDE